MNLVHRNTRALVAIAAASLVAIALAYLWVPPDEWTRVVVADLSRTWTACYAGLCALLAARRHPDPAQRSAWRWIGSGCALYIAAQLVWDYYELWERVRPPYPSLADTGYLGIYVCFAVAVVKLAGAHPRRRGDAELLLDAVLVTLTAGALAYAFLLRPLLRTGGDFPALVTSIGWSVGGIVVLWLILVELLRSTRVPLATAALGIPALVVLCLSNAVYAVNALQGTFHAGGAIDLGWDAGFILLAVAALVAPSATRGEAAPGEAPSIAGDTARLLAVTIGLAGVGAIAIGEALAPRRDPAVALLEATALVVVGARFAYSLRADRRYESLLEHAVASQTRSLMDSLVATAAAERHLRLVIDAVPDAIVVLDREGRIVEANAPATRMAGTAAASLSGRSVFEFIEPTEAGVVRERLAAAFQGEVQRFEVPFKRDDGSRGITSLLYAPVREGDAIPRLLVVARDITDQRRAESQLQQAEKLAAMGQLVSGVAHEINNPAAIVSGFAQTLLLDELKPEHREMLQIVYDEATRIGRITSNLLAFARAGGKQRTLVDLNDLCRRTFALRSYYLSTLNITVTLELDPADPKAWADGSELQQLLLNLLINAEQALTTQGGAGTITIRTGGDERAVQLAVLDTGPGIAPEIRSRIFDPFFTTKPEGVGTGLGLSICYGIVQEHGGRIWVESEPGQGARFFVSLPRDPRRESRPERHAAPAAAASPGTVSVLVVDDEIALRNALLRFLARRGIEGLGAADGAEALQLLRHQQFDVIISDVRMPGMSGREFLATLRRERPELVDRLVFSTGDTFAPDTAALLKEAGVPTVIKPFDFAALELTIRDVAAGTARAPRTAG